MNRRGFCFSLAFLVSVFLLCGILACDSSAKSPFGYRYLGTVGWVPGSGYVNSSGWNASAYYALDTGTAFGRRPDLIAVHSPSDFRWFPMSSNHLANAELMKLDMTAGQVDSLMAGASAIPAAGKTYYGYFPWFVAHATTDTLWVDGYVED